MGDRARGSMKPLGQESAWLQNGLHCGELAAACTAAQAALVCCRSVHTGACRGVLAWCGNALLPQTCLSSTSAASHLAGLLPLAGSVLGVSQSRLHMSCGSSPYCSSPRTLSCSLQGGCVLSGLHLERVLDTAAALAGAESAWRFLSGTITAARSMLGAMRHRCAACWYAKSTNNKSTNNCLQSHTSSKRASWAMPACPSAAA